MSRSHIKQTYRLDLELTRKIADLSRQRGLSQTEVVEAALRSFFKPDQEERIEALLSRRLDRVGRQLDRLEWHGEMLGEALALFVRHWLTSTPPLPDEALAAAQASGKRRWEGFVDALSRRMEVGPKLAAELMRDVGDTDRSG
ncbi:MAG: CopG family transcriptional regulator [Sphingopyxis sp.]|uniref:CopG family transcriptional regulator n=1 Tax=Sphingopyxis sp. TaxID=1908224 RepID=UPI002ABC9C41|nr:CopG family transcriptional regulator [Sphingopyxis sp.]MDZ3831909.1 CopG family transcriptional regulator [Sphingopyxis sp.]